ncbi:type IV pilin [Methanosphaerula palustris]|nr:type IV pilin N-terminal domain-containing protein [Methanosphaerula palustris]
MTHNEDADSLVIGVILMVAVTVILAAVIAAFVFGMAGSIEKQYVVDVGGQVDTASNTVLLTYYGGQDANRVTGLNYSVDGGIPGSISPVVGTSVSGIPRGHIVVTASIKDGPTVVILNSNY